MPRGRQRQRRGIHRRRGIRDEDKVVVVASTVLLDEVAAVDVVASTVLDEVASVDEVAS